MLDANRTRSAKLGSTLQVLMALWNVNHALEVTSSRMLRDLGITAQQRFLLRIVAKSGPIAAGPLAALLHVHPGTLSSALGRLERRQLLKRVRDAEDARRVLITITPRGRRITEPSRRTVESAVAAVLRRRGKTETRALVEALNRISAQLRANGDGEPD